MNDLKAICSLISQIVISRYLIYAISRRPCARPLIDLVAYLAKVRKHLGHVFRIDKAHIGFMYISPAKRTVTVKVFGVGCLLPKRLTNLIGYQTRLFLPTQLQTLPRHENPNQTLCNRGANLVSQKGWDTAPTTTSKEMSLQRNALKGWQRRRLFALLCSLSC